MFFKANLYAFAALYTAVFVKGQAFLTVTVGAQGSFYNPAFISAAINDTITFVFQGQLHTVTQSTFGAPCSPLSGGFDSGLAGVGANTTKAPPTWNLTITDDTDAIWYFCAATQPMSHCAAGMVGVINPPSIAMYDEFVAAAKLVTGTPSPIFSVILTGQGAFATNSPSASLLPITSSPPLTSTSSSFSTPTSTSTQSSSPSPTNATVSATTSHLGAIVGGSVGGSIALIGLFFILWLYCLRKKKVPNDPMTPESDEFFRYNPVPGRRPREAFVEAKQAEIVHNNTSVTSYTNSSVTTPPAMFSPVRRQFPQSGPIILQPPNLHREPSTLSSFPSEDLSATSTRQMPEQSGNIDLRALAQEVAAVLYQSPSKNLDQPHMTIQNHDDPDSPNTSQTQPPPNYRAATGPSIRKKVRDP